MNINCMGSNQHINIQWRILVFLFNSLLFSHSFHGAEHCQYTITSKSPSSQLLATVWHRKPVSGLNYVDEQKVTFCAQDKHVQKVGRAAVALLICPKGCNKRSGIFWSQLMKISIIRQLVNLFQDWCMKPKLHFVFIRSLHFGVIN